MSLPSKTVKGLGKLDLSLYLTSPTNHRCPSSVRWMSPLHSPPSAPLRGTLLQATPIDLSQSTNHFSWYVPLFLFLFATYPPDSRACIETNASWDTSPIARQHSTCILVHNYHSKQYDLAYCFVLMLISQFKASTQQDNINALGLRFFLSHLPTSPSAHPIS